MTNQRYSVALIFLLLPVLAFCQSDIPINAWRVHPSFYSIHSIALKSDKRVFAASPHGLLTIERSDNALTTHTTLDGLKGNKITTIAYDNTTNNLTIAYEDGTFDLMDSNSHLINFDPTASSNLSGSKRINSVAIFGGLSYISTDYGVVVFDLSKRQIKETWRDLSETGSAFKIYGSTVRNDSIYLATERGVIAASLNTNLQDFNSWKRFNAGVFNAPVKLITSFNNVVYCAIDNDGIYSLRGSSWMKEPFLPGESFLSLTSSATSLIVTTLNRVWSISESAGSVALQNDLITAPQFAIEDQSGSVWIADAVAGLITESSGNYEAYRPNSPSNDVIAGMSYHDQSMFVFSGGYSSSGEPLKNKGVINIYKAGSWSAETTSVSDVTSVLARPSGPELYVASFGQGLEVRDAGGTQKIWDAANSSMTNVGPPEKSVNVSSLAFSDDGLWVTNYGSTQPLHLLKPDQTWEAFAFNTTSSRYITKLQVDFLGNVWMIIDPAHGGGVMIFNRENGTNRYLTEIEGQGGLPARNVYSIALDRDGLVWVGTDLGAAYFNVSASIFSSPVNAIKPVVDGRFLLRDDRVTAIAVDGGNRKWFKVKSSDQSGKGS